MRDSTDSKTVRTRTASYLAESGVRSVEEALSVLSRPGVEVFLGT